MTINELLMLWLAEPVRWFKAWQLRSELKAYEIALENVNKRIAEGLLARNSIRLHISDIKAQIERS